MQEALRIVAQLSLIPLRCAYCSREMPLPVYPPHLKVDHSDEGGARAVTETLGILHEELEVPAVFEQMLVAQYVLWNQSREVIADAGE